MNSRMSAEQGDLWDLMSTNRAFRRFTDEPVDDALLRRCLEAATWAPSGGNLQPWRFVLLRSPQSRQALSVAAERALVHIRRQYGFEAPGESHDPPSTREIMIRDLFRIHQSAADVPAAVLFCTRFTEGVPLLLQGASIYPAMENFLLAARAQGLGTLVTGWHVSGEAELRESVGVPEEWQLAALVVVGRPDGKFTKVRRKPVSQVACIDRWSELLSD